MVVRMRAPSVRVIVGAVGLIWGLLSELVYYRAGTPAYQVLLDLAIGWTYLYGGLALWASRPANRTGRLMTLVGLLWFVGNVGISDLTGLAEVAILLSEAAAVAVIALVLAYPTGRLETRLDRVTVVLLAIGFTAINAIQFLPLPQDAALDQWRLYARIALAIFAGIVVLRRWFVAPRRRRPELLPVLVAGSVLLGVLVSFLVVQTFPVSEGFAAFLEAARILAPAAIPLALLVGFYRQSERRQRALVDAMPDLMVRLTPGGQYIDIRPDDSDLLDGPVDSLVGGPINDVLPVRAAEAIMSAAAVAIDTGELQTRDVSIETPTGRRDVEIRITRSGSDEVTAIVRDFTEQRVAQSEVRQSRARIVDATDAERRRLERDLHDGAQQRLVSLTLALRLARTRLSRDTNPAALAGLDDVATELKTALQELRELAHGIHPAILTQAGLGPAIDSLTKRSTVPAAVTVLPARRLSPAIEATAYFVVSEALANVAKYAAATSATVAAECPGDSLRVEVADDGIGGADPAGGSGLRGLADRVAAIGGSLTVDSPAGGGTRIVAVIPTGP
jgi:signal transduction histidine kinase